MSRQIQTLEDNSGVPLFERRHRELRRLTRGIYATAKSVLDELAQAVAKIRREQTSLPSERFDDDPVRQLVADSPAVALSREASGHGRVHIRR